MLSPSRVSTLVLLSLSRITSSVKDQCVKKSGQHVNAKQRAAKLELDLLPGRDYVDLYLERDEYCVDGGSTTVDIGPTIVDVDALDIGVEINLRDKKAPKVRNS